jgi:Fic family protein
MAEYLQEVPGVFRERERLRARRLEQHQDRQQVADCKRQPPPAAPGRAVPAARGEVQRGEVAEVVGASARTARRVVAELTDIGIVQSASLRAPVQLRFPAEFAGRCMPGLFPERPLCHDRPD